VKKIGEQIKGAQDIAMHVKGLELPAYDPRGSTGMALAYATSDRGGCHLRSWPIGDELLATEDRMDLSSIEFKAELVKNQQDLFCTLPKRFFSEPLKEGPCRDRVVELDQLIEEYYLVRGWDESGVPEKDKLKELGIDSN